MLKLLWECWKNGRSLAEARSEVRAALRELETRQTQLELEWGDVLDKLLAREDRQRKRDKKQAAELIEPEQPAFNLQPQRRLLGRK